MALISGKDFTKKLLHKIENIFNEGRNFEYAFFEEDIFKPASKKEVGRRVELEKERQKREEEEKKRRYWEDLKERNKVVVKTSEMDHGDVKGSKTVSFFGRKVSVDFTCNIEGGSPQTMWEPGEPAYPVLAGIQSAEDEDGPVPITDALMEVVADNIDMNDCDFPDYGPDPDDYYEDR